MIKPWAVRQSRPILRIAPLTVGLGLGGLAVVANTGQSRTPLLVLLGALGFIVGIRGSGTA